MWWVAASAEVFKDERKHRWEGVTLDFFQTYPIFFSKLTLDLFPFSTTAPAVLSPPRRDIYHSIELVKAVRMVYATCRVSHCRWRYSAVSAGRTSGTYPRLFDKFDAAARHSGRTQIKTIPFERARQAAHFGYLLDACSRRGRGQLPDESVATAR